MKLYRNLAIYYDEIYHFKNYKREARRIKALITKYKKSKGKKLLDVACGTGIHLTFLKPNFDVEGLDSSREMLRVARKKHPHIVFRQGDMTNFKLAGRYDIVTCLFSAVGHLKTRKRMELAVQRMAAHLKPGGVMIVEPWITPRNFKSGHLGGHFVNKPDLKIARMDIAKVRGSSSNFEFHYLIGTPNQIRYLEDKESLGLWTHKQYMRALRKSGLRAKYDPTGLMGRGLYIGVKPLDKETVHTICTPLR